MSLAASTPNHDSAMGHCPHCAALGTAHCIDQCYNMAEECDHTAGFSMRVWPWRVQGLRTVAAEGNLRPRKVSPQFLRWRPAGDRGEEDNDVVWVRRGLLIAVIVGVVVMLGHSPTSHASAPRIHRTAAQRSAILLKTGPPFWLPMASMHGACGCVAALGLDGRIYALGGLSDKSFYTDAEVYTPATDSWATIAPMLHSRSDFGAATGPDGHIYAISGGGRDAITSTEAYVPGRNRWVPRPDVPGEHWGGSAVRGPDGRIFMIGGSTGVDGLPEVDAYDIHTKQWTHVTDLPTPRAFLGVAVGLDGRIYTVGGTPGIYYDYTATEAYDVVTGQWTHLADLPWAREALAAATGADGRIYAIGGTEWSGDATQDRPHLRLSSMPTTRGRTSGRRWRRCARPANLAAVRGPDGRIYAIGGADTTAGLATMEAYGPVIHLMPAQSAPGHAVVLTGTNFAANATVAVTWGAIPGGTVLGTARTDRAGNLPHAVTVVIPPGVLPGHYMITAEDDRSRYPVTARVAVGVPAVWETVPPPHPPRPSRRPPPRRRPL